MKLAVSAPALANALRSGIHGRSSNQISETVLLSPSDSDTLKIVTHVNDQQLEQTIECSDIESPQRFCLAVAGLAQVILGRTDEVSLEITERAPDCLIVKDGRSRFKLPLINADSFPLDEAEFCYPININGEDLKQAITKVSHFSEKDKLGNHSGYIQIEPGFAVAAKTWGMSTCEINFDQKEFQIAARDADLAAKHLRAESKIYTGKTENFVNRLIIENQDSKLSLGFYSQIYPDWRSIVNKTESVNRTTFQADEFIAAARRCVTPANYHAQSNYYAIALTPQLSKLKLSCVIANSISEDSGADVVDTENTELSESIKPIALNVDLLALIFAKMKGEKVCWSISAQPFPQKFFVEGRPETHYIMPTKL